MKFFVAFLFFFLAGCAPGFNNFTIKPADNPHLEGYQPWIFEGAQITEWFCRKSFEVGSSPKFSPWIDDKYFVLEYENAIKAFGEFEKTVWGKTFRANARDCDDYAFFFRSWLQFLFADTFNIDAAPSVAVLFVKQIYDFGGISGTGNGHAVIGVGTSEGAIIFEPQTGSYTKLEEYPNRKFIYYILR